MPVKPDSGRDREVVVGRGRHEIKLEHAVARRNLDLAAFAGFGGQPFEEGARLLAQVKAVPEFHAERIKPGGQLVLPGRIALHIALLLQDVQHPEREIRGERQPPGQLRRPPCARIRSHEFEHFKRTGRRRRLITFFRHKKLHLF